MKYIGSGISIGVNMIIRPSSSRHAPIVVQSRSRLVVDSFVAAFALGCSQPPVVCVDQLSHGAQLEDDAVGLLESVVNNCLIKVACSWESNPTPIALLNLKTWECS